MESIFVIDMILIKAILLASLLHIQDTVPIREAPIKKFILTDNTATVLHDSLMKGKYNFINLSALKGWKFSPDDDPAFAQPGFDDSYWYSIEKLSVYEDALPDSLWEGFGWLRLRLQADSLLTGTKKLIYRQWSPGAAEMYINGELVLKRGNPTPDPTEQVLVGRRYNTFGKLYEFQPGQTYHIAIRYSLHNIDFIRKITLRDITITVNPRFSLLDFDKFDLYNSDQHSFRIREAVVLTSAAVTLFLVMILHLVLYLYIKDENSNGWICLLNALLFAILLLLTIYSLFPIDNFWLSIMPNNLMVLLAFLSLSLVPLVIHKVLRIEPYWLWKYFIPFQIAPIIIIASFDVEGIGFWSVLVVILLALSGGIVAIFKARQLKRENTVLITWSILAFPIFIVLSGISFQLFGEFGEAINILSTFGIFTVMPLGLSIYQVKQFLGLHTHLDNLVGQRTSELQQSLNNLKATQSQLIQSEKMASLGELTAGIAHEIQNPLNFVNNFSEVSNELLDEMREEIEKKNFDEVKAITNDVKQNLAKVLHHGKRADAIVKGMLQHSRGSSGVKEPTDINALADEYLRLAYHGLRAKDKSFNAKFETHFDESIGMIEVVPQDIGRVILNLITNAFYAVSEKMKRETADVKSGPSHVSPLTSHYEPTVTIFTKKLSDKIEIRVKDNGNGIPDSIKEKIFQPFFTTRPTGQGTGLGLSLSYDIVKAHGGKLWVESMEGKGSSFTVQLQNG
jgi:signal transduction histidine kinase